MLPDDMSNTPESVQETMFNLEEKMRKQIKTAHSYIINEMNKTMNNIINLFLQNAEQLEMFIKSDVNFALNEISMANQLVLDNIHALENQATNPSEQNPELSNSYDSILDNDLNDLDDEEQLMNSVGGDADIALDELELAMASPNINGYYQNTAEDISAAMDIKPFSVIPQNTSKNQSYKPEHLNIVTSQKTSSSEKSESSKNNASSDKNETSKINSSSEKKESNTPYTTQNSIPNKPDESKPPTKPDPNTSKYFQGKPESNSNQKPSTPTPVTPKVQAPAPIPMPPPKPKEPLYYVSKPRNDVDEEKLKFKCNKCDYRCGYRNHLTTHDISVHQNRRSFVCEHCNGVFSSKTAITCHIKRTHAKNTD